MDYREEGSHARGAYSTQDTSRLETARVKQEEEVDTRNIVMEEHEIKKRGHYKRVNPKQGL